MKVAIIDYGTGNVQSLQFALERLGYGSIVTKDKNVIRNTERVIFPGVGAAGIAMQRLEENELCEVIQSLSQPVLGICLGMQLMCQHSEENDTKTLNIFNDKVVKFNDMLKVPQVGWNSIYDFKSILFDGITDNDFVYMVHGFYVPQSDSAIATTHYGISYASALQKNNFYGVQFHPEKSGKTGERILLNFLNIKL